MQREGLAAEALGQPQRFRNALFGLVAQSVCARRMHVDCEPRHAGALRHALRRPHELLGHERFVDAHQKPVLGRPGSGDGVRAHVVDHLRVDPLGGDAHRELAQRGEIALAEEMLQGAADLAAHVDLAFAQPLDQVVRRQVDQLDLIGELQDLVRQGLADAHAGDALHDVVQALDVLDVERGEDIDPGGEQFLHVLMALDVAAALDVGMGELVDDGELRLAPEQRVEVHLGEDAAAIHLALPRQHLETAQQRLGLGPAVGLDHADHHVRRPPRRRSLRGLEHRVGLADARVSAEEDLEPAAPFLLGLLEQRLGGGPPLLFNHPCPLPLPRALSSPSELVPLASPSLKPGRAR